jgi:YidC/Oxa1 family membrane protein insertase
VDISYLFMLPLLEILDKTLGSYGWAIIGLTLAVRILVWPLVSASTKSMQSMQKMQPKLKAMQEKYKDDPQELQKRMAEFYMKNKINPFGGCLPMLVQLPILFALFGTFTGPPFQDKAIPVKIKIVAADKADKTVVTQNPTSSADSAYVSKDGKLSKLVVHPGDSTLVLGRQEGQPTKDGFSTIDFTVGAKEGELSPEMKPTWKIAVDPDKAMLTPEGQATFPAAGDITIAAVIPASVTGSTEQIIPVKVRVLPKKEGEGGFPFPGGGSSEDAIKEKKVSSETTVSGTIDGKAVKLAVEPGDMTIVAGKGANFHVRAVEGSLPESFVPEWKVVDDPNGSMIDENGKAVFKHPGEIVVNAMIPGVAKHEPFLFMSSIGKVAKGTDLLKPENFDVLSLILLFGVTMFLSQKFMVTSTPADPEQAAVQKQTQQIMPFTVTGMFFFMPLPAGVYLYMVFSNVVQTLQTWLLMRSPAPDLDDGDEDVPASKAVIDVVPNDKKGKKSKALESSAKSEIIDASPNDKKGKKGEESRDSDENPVKLNLTEKEQEGKNK